MYTPTYLVTYNLRSLADFFFAQLRLVSGSTVAICLPNSPAFAVAFLLTTWQVVRQHHWILRTRKTGSNFVSIILRPLQSLIRDSYRKKIAAVLAAGKDEAAIEATTPSKEGFTPDRNTTLARQQRYVANTTTISFGKRHHHHHCALRPER